MERKWSSSLVLASQKVREGAAGGGLLDTCHNNINIKYIPEKQDDY